MLVYPKIQINSLLSEHCREKLIKVDAQYFKWFFVFAVTTQREAIIFFTAEVLTLLTTMLLHFLVKYNYIFFFFIVILVGLLNDTENLVFYVKHDLLCLHFREYIILLVCFFFAVKYDACCLAVGSATRAAYTITHKILINT